MTGAHGLLGSDLCRRLSRSWEVVAWGQPEANITDAAQVSAGLRQVRPEVVVHAAAMTDVDACEGDPDGAFRVNAEGTRIVAEGCRSVEAFLIALSTDYAFDGLAGRPYREEDPPSPVSVYARSKVAAEAAALKAARRAAVVRVSGLFGGARDNFVKTASEKLRAGQEVPVVTDQINSPSYTRDVAEGLAQLVDLYGKDPDSAEPGQALHGVLHLANAGGANRLEVAEEIAAVMGRPNSLLRRTTWAELNRPARRPPNSQLDCSRFARLTGAALRGWREAVRSFVREEILK